MARKLKPDELEIWRRVAETANPIGPVLNERKEPTSKKRQNKGPNGTWPKHKKQIEDKDSKQNRKATIKQRQKAKKHAKTKMFKTYNKKQNKATKDNTQKTKQT